MRVTMATSAKGQADRPNEDFAGAVPTAAVLVDGAGIPGTERLCRHGVAWYAATLGGSLLGLLQVARDRGLTDLLGTAITQVTDLHRETCEVTHPLGPSAAVAVLRVSQDRAEYLVLGDAVVVLDRAGEAPLVAGDPREVVVSRSYEPALEAAGKGSAAYERILRDLRSHRNHPGGFWVAKDDPRAADEAVTGSCPATGLRAAVLLSNGASGIVDRFGLADWPGVLDVLADAGPAAIIRSVRQAEARLAVAADDATIAYCTDLAPDFRLP